MTIFESTLTLQHIFHTNFCTALYNRGQLIQGVELPAMAMDGVYERLHCVLNLISYIFYALHREDQKRQICI